MLATHGFVMAEVVLREDAVDCSGTFAASSESGHGQLPVFVQQVRVASAACLVELAGRSIRSPRHPNHVTSP